MKKFFYEFISLFLRKMILNFPNDKEKKERKF